MSPHLQVYRLAFGTILSGLNRLTGIALAASSLLLVFWLVATARGPGAYETAIRFFSSLPVRLVLICAVIAFWFHLFAGLRHLAWDAGLGFEKTAARSSGITIVALTLLASALTLAMAWRFLATGQ